MPTLLIFPLVLFATGFFTPGEREKLGRMLHRRRGRKAEPALAAGGASAASGAAAVGAAASAQPAPGATASATTPEAEGGAPVDRAHHLSADDEEAEEEELEMEKEADVDFIEGPTTTTIT